MREPKNTCPTIDRFISGTTEMWEEIRTLNSELREWGQHWLDEYESLESSTNIEIEYLKDTINDLQDEIRSLKDEIHDLKRGVSA